MRRDNQATIGLGRECRNSTLDLGSVMHGKRENLYTERWCSGLDCTQEPDIWGANGL